MITVWKFGLALSGDVHLEMPEGAQVLKVDTQFDEPTMWVICDPAMKSVVRNFVVYMTGQHINDKPLVYAGSFQLDQGNYVGHVFERL